MLKIKEPEFHIKIMIACALFLLYLFIMRCSTVKTTGSIVEHTALTLAKNKDIQKYGATVSGFLYVWFNSKQDATQHGGKFHIDQDGFHRYKHWANTFGGITVFFKTCGWLSGNYTLWELTKRTTAEGALWFQTWQNCYDFWKYDKILDYREGIWNDHRYVQPFGDRYMKFKSWQMITIDAGMTTGGIFYLLKNK